MSKSGYVAGSLVEVLAEFTVHGVKSANLRVEKAMPLTFSAYENKYHLSTLFGSVMFTGKFPSANASFVISGIEFDAFSGARIPSDLQSVSNLFSIMVLHSVDLEKLIWPKQENENEIV